MRCSAQAFFWSLICAICACNKAGPGRVAMTRSSHVPSSLTIRFSTPPVIETGDAKIT